MGPFLAPSWLCLAWGQLLKLFIIGTNRVPQDAEVPGVVGLDGQPRHVGSLQPKCRHEPHRVFGGEVAAKGADTCS